MPCFLSCREGEVKYFELAMASSDRPPLAVTEVERSLRSIARSVEQQCAREDRFHPGRLEAMRTRHDALIEAAVAAQTNLVAQYAQISEHSHGPDALSTHAPGRENASQHRSSSGEVTRDSGLAKGNSGAADLNLVARLDALDDRVGAFDPYDMDRPRASSADDENGEDNARGPVGFLSSSDDEVAEGGDTGATADSIDEAAGVDSSTQELSRIAAASLAAARRAAAKRAAAEARGETLPLDDTAPGRSGGGGAGMTYEEFMAAGNVGRVPRRGERVAGGLSAEDEKKLEDEGYVMSGRRNLFAQKRLEATQRQLHHLQAQKQRLDLVAEEHRRRDESRLEGFRKLLAQPRPPGDEPDSSTQQPK
jgi:hypothetical protein